MDDLSLSSLKDAEFEAWTRLSAVLGSKMRHAIESIVGTSCPEAEDMVSEVLSRLVRKVNDSYFKDMGHLEGTAIKIAKDLGADYIKRRSISPIIDIGDGTETNMVAGTDPSPREQLEEADEHELANSMLNWLRAQNPKQYAIVKCIAWEDKTYEETARELGLPEGTVSGELSRGLARMKKKISQHPDWKNALQLKYPWFQLTLKIILLALLMK